MWLAAIFCILGADLFLGNKYAIAILENEG
jgi:hypothetical protein